MGTQTVTQEKGRTVVVAALLMVSVVAMSAVAAGVATADAETTDGPELTVDETDSIDSDGSAEFSTTVTNSGDEDVTTDVVFEIDGQVVTEEVTIGADDTESVTFTAEGYVFDEGEYDWTITADGEERSGVLTVSDDADEESAGEENADDETTDEDGANDDEAAHEPAEDEPAEDESAEDEGAEDEGADDETAGDDESADDEADDEDAAEEDAADENADEEDAADGAADDEAADEGDEEGDGMPGFGVGVALIALLAAAMLTLRRQG